MFGSGNLAEGKNTAQFCALLGESAEDGLNLNGQPAPSSTTQFEPRVVNPNVCCKRNQAKVNRCT